MKKTLLLFSALSIMMIGKAQIPNAGFEDWKDDDPVGYVTSNLFVKFFNAFAGQNIFPYNVTKTADGHTGSAIRLETMNYSLLKDTLPGFAIIGDTNRQGVGFAFSERPTLFSGYYKATVPAKDTVYIAAGLYKYNPITKNQDSIGGAFLISTTSSSTYLSFSVPFIYTSSVAIPDSASIFIASSGKSKIPGSVVFVDDLSFSGVTGTLKSFSFDYTPSFPNPVKDVLNITNIPGFATTVEIKDLQGKSIQVLPASQSMEVNVSDFQPSLYCYTVRNASGGFYMQKNLQ